MAKPKLIINIDGVDIIYYDGVLDAPVEMKKTIMRNAALNLPVQTIYMAEPVKASLEDTLVNVAAAIISVYPERARIIEAPEDTINQFYPEH